MYFMYMYCVLFIVCCQWRNERWWQSIKNVSIRDTQ